MALGTNKVAAVSSSGLVAASARPASGGRNVASVSRDPLGEAEFSAQLGINDNSILLYDEERAETEQRKKRQEKRGTPFMVRAAWGFTVEEIDDTLDHKGPAKIFLAILLHGIETYESNMRLTTPGAVRPGSVVNYLY